MSGWFRRGRDEPPEPQPPAGDDDSPPALLGRLWAQVQFVNRSAGRLPVEAVVVARGITDAIREAVETASEGGGTLDVYAIVSINGIVRDYLPTTLQTYLGIDPQLTDRPGPSGATPRAALLEQLYSLAGAATDLLRATHAHDVDAMFTQGNFLRTKFSRSDLDLDLDL